MNQEASSDRPPSDLAPQLVNILYSHTNLNYDVCAVGLAGVFAHLGQQMPELGALAQSLIESMKTSVGQRQYNPDLGKLERHLNYIIEINEFLQSGEKNFYECASEIEKALDESILLLVNTFPLFSIFPSS